MPSPPVGAAERNDVVGSVQHPVDGWETLPNQVKTLWRLEAASAAAAMCIGLLVLQVWSTRPAWVSPTLLLLLFAGVLVALAVDVFAVIPARHKNYRYQVGTEHLLIRQGRVFERLLCIPLDRVLLVEQRYGPMKRRLGLVAIRFGTIVDRHELGPVSSERSTSLWQSLQKPEGHGECSG